MLRANFARAIFYALLAALCASLLAASGASAQSCVIEGIRDRETGKLFEAARQASGEFAPGAGEGEDEQDPAKRALEALSQHWVPLIARAAVAKNGEGVQQAEELASNLSEVVRNDKQAGSPGGASGTTTLSERAAIPLLLGLAVEHGAIRQEQSGTSLTLSTSPYGFLTATREDDADLYKNNAWARAIGVSANFSLEGDGSQGLNGLKQSELSSISAKFVIGDRTTRATKFQEEKWKAKLEPLASAATNAELAAWDTALGNDLNSEIASVKKGFLDWANDELPKGLTEKMGARPLETKAGRDGLRDDLMNLIEPKLCELVFAKVTDDMLDRDEVAAKFEVARKANVAATKALVTAIEEFQSETPLFSLGYTLNRTVGGSDYSEIKLIGDGLFLGGGGPLELIVNANLAINHEPDSALGQNTIRDYGANFSLAWTTKNRLTDRLPGSSEFSTIALSFSGEFRRLADIGENVGTAQLRIDLPFTSGLQLPLSFSYSTRTETSSKDDFTIGFGFEFDTDKLLALAGLGGK